MSDNSDGDGDLAGLRPVPARIHPTGEPPTSAERDLRDRLARQREAMRTARCPSCGAEPVAARARWEQRQDLAIVWLYADPQRDSAVIERHHCARCQPHQHVQTIICPLCTDGPIVAGDLADLMATLGTPPEPVRRWLDKHGWHDDPDHGLVCAEHQVPANHS